MSEGDKLFILKKRLRKLSSRLRRYASGYKRLVTSAFGKEHVLPDFLIIGAMKCGTTSLFHYLQQHPGIIGSSRKEVNFLDNPRLYRFGETWYRSHFPARQAMESLSDSLGYKAVTGEATPAMFSNFYAINAGKHVPDARLIIVLRDPVERAYSHYHHIRRRSFKERLSFWDALHQEDECIAADMKLNREDPAKAVRMRTHYSYSYSYSWCGMYIEQIEYWLRFFPREQLKIFHFDHLTSQPGEVCNEVCAFLGLPEYEFETREKRKTGHYNEPMDERSRDYLTDLFRPYNRRLFEFLGEDWGWPS